MKHKVKPVKAKKSSPKKSVPAAAARRPSELVSFYQMKLEAEWGPYDLKKALDDGPERLVVLDTRKPEDYAEEHIPLSVNIPMEELESRLNELPKDKAVVPYCWTIVCHLATRAALLLAKKGYTVHELAGGIGTWKEYGLPVTSKAQEPALR